MKISNELKARIYQTLAEYSGNVLVLDNGDEMPILLYLSNYSEPTPNQSVGGVYSASFLGIDITPIMSGIANNWKKDLERIMADGIKVKLRVSCNQQYSIFSF